MRHHGAGSFNEYFQVLTEGGESGELRVAIDLLTTHETYFFREPKHFDFLRDQVLAGWKPGRQFRAWSAASSSGEEPYSIAMLLADKLGDGPWEVLGSDISEHALERARAGHYALERLDDLPKRYLSQYCLKGIGSQEGSFLIARELRSRVGFMRVNLNADLPNLGAFDVIFLRNVMIYFDMGTKQQVVARMLPLLKPGGHFIIGHAESLNGVTEGLQAVALSIYQGRDARGGR